MGNDGKQRASEVFFAVCDLEAAERDARLSELCGDDHALKTDVRAMLGLADRQTESGDGPGLTQIVERGARRASVRVAREFDVRPEALGPYRIVDELGEGGMSVVYLAEQSTPVKRHVALKVIRPGMDTREVLARFESERQALAVMDHPNIARIYDAGTSEQGRPYFAMELVQGVPLTRYCDERRLSVRERLDLFIGVCDAVAHAHQKGVVHRDLKPSNILVSEHDGNAQVKVIDFGIAKAIDARLSDDPLVTQLGQMIGTPGYMSPEQAAARVDEIDTRTDVYSLGVVLYQLLVGALPINVQDHSAQELSTLIAEGHTPRPSARLQQLGNDAVEKAAARATEPAALRQSLARSLDWVVLKAMEKSRARRYQSVYEFKADLQNYLAHRPVVARPPTRRYVLGQFVRRNRSTVTVASIVVLALVAGVTLATIGLLRAVESEREAQRRATTTTRVADMLVAFFQEQDPTVARGRDVRVLDVLDDNVERIMQRLDEEPEVQARLLLTVGVLYNSLAEHAKAVPVLEQALSQLDSLPKASAATRADVLSELGEARRQTDELEAARDAHTLARSLRIEALGSDSAAVADSDMKLGNVAFDMGDYETANAAADRSLAIARPLLPAPAAQAVVADALNMRAVVASVAGDLALAERSHREVLQIKRQLHGEMHPSVATTLNNLGAVLAKRRKYDEAEAAYREALSMRETLFEGDNTLIGTTINNLASLLYRRGDLDAAEQLYRRSLAIRRAEAYPSTAVATALNNLGTLLSRKGDDAGAVEAFGESIEVRREVQGDDHPYTAITRMNLAEHELSVARIDAACAPLPQIEEVLGAALPADHWRLAALGSLKGSCRMARGQLSEAEPLLLDSLAALRAARGDASPEAERAVDRVIGLYAVWPDQKKKNNYEQLRVQMRSTTEGNQP